MQGSGSLSMQIENQFCERKQIRVYLIFWLENWSLFRYYSALILRFVSGQHRQGPASFKYST